MSLLNDIFKDPISTVHEVVKGSFEDEDPTAVYDALSWIPGSPEGAVQGLYEGFKEDRSWNPYDPEEASVWDRGAGGEWSTDPEKRQYGRMIGTMALGMTGNALIGPTATGSGLGAAQAAGAGGDRDEIGKGALRGGVQAGAASYLNGLNPAGYIGIDNPMLAAGVNGFLGSGLTAAANDREDWEKEGVKGGIQAMLPYVGNSLSSLFAPDTSYVPTNQSQAVVNDVNQASMQPRQSNPDWYGQTSPAMSQAPAYVPPTSNLGYVPTETNSMLPNMSEVSQFFSNLMPQNRQQWGDVVQGLAGIYMANKNRRSAKDLLQSYQGRRGGYEDALRRQLQRRDAASGRRSNYDAREAELQAQLARLDSANLPAMQSLVTAKNLGTLGMLSSGLRMAGNLGVFGQNYTRNPEAPQQMPSYNPEPMSVPSIYDPQMTFDQPQDLSTMYRRNRVVGGM